MDIIVTITGPTCSGKSTLAGRLTELGIPEVQSFTTRAPRPYEQPQDPLCPYHFVTPEWVAAQPPGELIESVTFLGNQYGNTLTQMKAATAKCGIATVVVEPEGVNHWAIAAERMGFGHYAIYMDQPIQVLINRFVARWEANKSTTADVEVARLKSIIDIEVPYWKKRYPYDLVVTHDNEGVPSVPPVELFGFLKTSFAGT